MKLLSVTSHKAGNWKASIFYQTLVSAAIPCYMMGKGFIIPLPPVYSPANNHLTVSGRFQEFLFIFSFTNPLPQPPNTTMVPMHFWEPHVWKRQRTHLFITYSLRGHFQVVPRCLSVLCSLENHFSISRSLISPRRVVGCTLKRFMSQYLALCLSDQSDKWKYTFLTDISQEVLTKGPNRHLWSHLLRSGRRRSGH